MNPPFAISLERCVLEFRGADVVRFLNGQLSNDVRRLTPASAMHACVMTAKGRMNAEVWLTMLEDCIRVDGPEGLGEDLLARFERYVISDDVTIHDVSDAWHLLHVVGGTDGIPSRRFAVEGTDHWQKTLGIHPGLLTSAQAESFRIAQGIPLWGAELNDLTIPIEAGLDHDCIDYHKGCYIGQEVISRIKSVGHVNRLLVRLCASSASALARGDSLFAEDQVVGSITSVAPSLDLENVIALAYVKRNYSAPGTVLTTAAVSGETLAVLPLHS